MDLATGLILYVDHVDLIINFRQNHQINKKTVADGSSRNCKTLNPFKPEFTIVIFTHYKPRIAVVILDL